MKKIIAVYNPADVDSVLSLAVLMSKYGPENIHPIINDVDDDTMTLDRVITAAEKLEYYFSVVVLGVLMGYDDLCEIEDLVLADGAGFLLVTNESVDNTILQISALRKYMDQDSLVLNHDKTAVSALTYNFYNCNTTELPAVVRCVESHILGLDIPQRTNEVGIYSYLEKLLKHPDAEILFMMLLDSSLEQLKELASR